MKCPNCNSENNDSAKFCKKCGSPLKKEINHANMINSMNNGKSGGTDDKAKYIIIALIIVVIALAGVFAYVGFGSHHNDEVLNPVPNNVSAPAQSAQSTQSSQQSTQTSQSTTSAPATSMSILGGSFSTGSSLSAKTYASIYVGPEHSGEKVIIQIKYSRDGSSLNNGNMVQKTVSSSGYIEVKSADAYKYYPDYAVVNVYDTSNNLLDSVSVSLSPTSGTQSF